jgi:hypothetical protein
MTITNCPTCGAGLGGKSICYRCGTLAGIESRVQKAKQSIAAFVQDRSSVLPRRFQAHHFLWLCAIVPLLIVPAAVSLVYALRSMRRENRSINADFEWIAIVAAINLVISGLLLYQFYFLINDFYTQGPENLRDLLRKLFRFFQPQEAPPVKLTPV